ncbi:hypothetical protein E0L36_12765 [Streptomyces sp. AJS327]|uniref:hypothetical protein n=1 Tax=Streptomyces sp. AJS327 TaxID=2545265 RepID=UPI0015DEA4DA|nr:hypothetical protein [Streptomyces sp. AJS327]MBA0051737.1 hypothetical protein [Streptomyces sp. AJS327]
MASDRVTEKTTEKDRSTPQDADVPLPDQAAASATEDAGAPPPGDGEAPTPPDAAAHAAEAGRTRTKDGPVPGKPETERRADAEGFGPDEPEGPDEGAGDDGEADADLPSDEEEDEFGGEEPPPAPSSGGGLGAAAAAVVGAGLGVCSLTGTALSEMLRERKLLIAQLESDRGGDQIEAVFGAPWHASALLNGAFGLLALALGAVAFLSAGRRADGSTWVRAVGLGGLLLGVLGLLIAAGMYFDVLASQPEMPSAPTPPAPPQAP